MRRSQSASSKRYQERMYRKMGLGNEVNSDRVKELERMLEQAQRWCLDAQRERNEYQAKLKDTELERDTYVGLVEDLQSHVRELEGSRVDDG